MGTGPTPDIWVKHIVTDTVQYSRDFVGESDMVCLNDYLPWCKMELRSQFSSGPASDSWKLKIMGRPIGWKNFLVFLIELLASDSQIDLENHVQHAVMESRLQNQANNTNANPQPVHTENDNLFHQAQLRDSNEDFHPSPEQLRGSQKSDR